MSTTSDESPDAGTGFALAVVAFVILVISMGVIASAMGVGVKPEEHKRVEYPRYCEHTMTGAPVNFFFPCTKYDDRVEAI